MIFCKCTRHPTIEEYWQFDLNLVTRLEGCTEGTFPQFPLLPLELRITVWKLALPRVITLASGGRCPNTKLNPLLRTSKESRKVAQDWYASGIIASCEDFKACPKYVIQGFILILIY
jgi:hypothetical protein